MNHHLSEELMDVLTKVGNQFEDGRRKHIPVLIEVKNQAITWVITYLPYFLGKGISNGDKDQQHRKVCRKPILILAHNVTSHYNLQLIYGKDSMLVKDGVMKRKEGGVPYTTYVVPTALPDSKTSHDYDIFLAGTYYFETLAFGDFSAVVVFESNMLKTSVINEIIKSFPDAFMVFVKTEVDNLTEYRMTAKPGECRLISLAQENIQLFLEENNRKNYLVSPNSGLTNIDVDGNESFDSRLALVSEQVSQRKNPTHSCIKSPKDLTISSIPSNNEGHPNNIQASVVPEIGKQEIPSQEVLIHGQYPVESRKECSASHGVKSQSACHSQLLLADITRSENKCLVENQAAPAHPEVSCNITKKAHEFTTLSDQQKSKTKIIARELSTKLKFDRKGSAGNANKQDINTSKQKKTIGANGGKDLHNICHDKRDRKPRFSIFKIKGSANQQDNPSVKDEKGNAQDESARRGILFYIKRKLRRHRKSSHFSWVGKKIDEV